jgi:C-terminal processing protease CtpA/Prc
MKHLSFIMLFSFLSLCVAQSCDPAQGQELMSRSERTRLFARVWETVNDEYIYTDFRGADWQAARKTYGRSILNVKTNGEFYSLVDTMIFELGDDHSVYLSPWLACEEDGYDEEDSDSEDDSDEEADTLTGEEPTVTRLESDVLLIDLPSFNLEDTGYLLDIELRKALQKGDVDGLILDLRHNYGGYIDAAYEVLSNFVRGRLATEFDLSGKRPKRGEQGTLYRQFSSVPMVVLVDADTHSAAELTAGILQQSRGATVIGQTSAGNTEIILPFDFEDGSRLWLAIGGFTLADGSSLEGVGVIPDVVIQKPAQDDVYIKAGLEALGLSNQAENQ